MKLTILCKRVGLMLLLATMAGSAFSTPRYTDKETALNLAKALDKGTFDNQLITSTFIQAAEKGRYFIKVILENGGEQDWNMVRLHDLSRRESIVLQGNLALLFINDDTNEFVVLDKNEFTQQALKSTVFIKKYPNGDVLAGQQIAFRLHRFNLSELLNLKMETDELGYRKKYVLDMSNGQREQLSFLEAYYTQERNGLVADPADAAPVMESPYRLQRISRHEFQETGVSGTGQFSIEMLFDRPIELKSAHFPYKFFELTERWKNPIENSSNFVVEITVPNAVLPKPVGRIKILEFLRNIRVLPDPDPDHPLRLLLQANLNPDVMTSPPLVTVEGSSVMISFTKVMNQSVLDRRDLEEADLRYRQEKLLNRKLSPDEVQLRRNFRDLMAKGEEQKAVARHAATFREKVEALFAALDNFRQAAELASSDSELGNSLRMRNSLEVKIPVMLVREARKSLKGQGGTDPSWLKGQLERAAQMTRNKRILKEIRYLLAN